MNSLSAVGLTSDVLSIYQCPKLRVHPVPGAQIFTAGWCAPSAVRVRWNKAFLTLNPMGNDSGGIYGRVAGL